MNPLKPYRLLPRKPLELPKILRLLPFLWHDTPTVLLMRQLVYNYIVVAYIYNKQPTQQQHVANNQEMKQRRALPQSMPGYLTGVQIRLLMRSGL